MNRTWNSFTIGGSSCTTAVLEDEHYSGENAVLGVLTSLGWSTDKIRLKGAGYHHYTIRYFDPYTKVQIEEVDEWSNIFGLGLVNYPLMGDGTNGHHPFYFFEAFEKGSEFDAAPMQSEDEFADQEPAKMSRIQSSTQNEQTLAIQMQESDDYTIFPNPTSTELIIQLSTLVTGEAIEIRNVMGEVVAQAKNQSSIVKLNVEHLAAGTYFVFIRSYPTIKMFQKL